jgi:multiple sugar transport system substrate-binding protein
MEAKKLSRRDFMRLSAAFVAGTTLAACAPKSTPAQEAATATPAQEASTATPVPVQAVELSTWTQDWNDEVREVISDELIPTFVEMNEDVSAVNIEFLPWGTAFFEKMTTAIASDTMPDVWEPALAGYGDNYREGWGLPLDDFIADSTILARDDFSRAAIEPCIHEGKLYGIPHRQDVRVWSYRQSILEEAGVTSVPKTWDEQLEAAVHATEREGDQLIRAGYPPLPTGYAAQNQWFINLVYQAGGDMLTEDNARAAFNSEEGKIAMEFSLEILDTIFPDHVFQLPEAALPDFVSGRVPVGYGSGPIRQMREHAPDEMSDIWFAGAIEGRGANATPSAVAFAGSKWIWHKSQNPAQGWKLIEFLNSPEYGIKWQEPYGSLPASKAILNAGYWAENEIDIQFAEEADKYGKSMIFMPEPGRMHETMGSEVAKVMFHEQTVQEGLDAAEKAWNEILMKYYS